MNWADVAIIALVVVSSVIGFFRGFVREAIGLATWVLAFYLAFVFADAGAAFVAQWIDTPSAQLAVAFAVIFIAALLIGALVNHFVGRLVSGTGFAGTDRVLGGVFGVLRGIAVLILLVLLAGVTPVPRDAWWQQSTLLDRLETGALWARDFLPPDLAGAVTYPDAPDRTAPSKPSST